LPLGGESRRFESLGPSKERFIGPYGKNFARTMLQRAAHDGSIRVDQAGWPTSAADLASALRTISLRLSASPWIPVRLFHTYYFANAGRLTW
jgi:dTDP-4-dehydrorhamnose reductase